IERSHPVREAMCGSRIDGEHRVVKLLQHFAYKQRPLLFASTLALVQFVDRTKGLSQLHRHGVHFEQGGGREWHAANVLATVVRKSREDYWMVGARLAFSAEHDPTGELVEPRDVIPFFQSTVF